jgi:hypothetical protein
MTPDVGTLVWNGVSLPLPANTVIVSQTDNFIEEDVRGYNIKYEVQNYVFDTSLSTEALLNFFDENYPEIRWNILCVVRPTVADPPATRMPPDDAGACTLPMGGPFAEDYQAHRLYQSNESHKHISIRVEESTIGSRGVLFAYNIVEMTLP